jgi:YVTN family beta-propeller protein
MTKKAVLISGFCLSLAACVGETDQPASTTAESQPPAGAYRIYITNETTGDLSVIDSSTHEVVASVPLGKRPRGIHASPDAKPSTSP